ncbi:sensor histidine kinase [Inquilinus sp. Marseille-Q2685]|uniref:sensor histidine kinase n=1 Tax=Inquilinus sp. Marseille-Q2685 TaxID=2866581 RepID=UPI001CE418ED|nr:HAMP domain-containing sensor histidine kinase [Inquilinus sp. Marseille-Q2685]
MTARRRRTPLTVKIPILVAALMLSAGVAASAVVLKRLEADQESYLRNLSASMLDGVALAAAPTIMRRDVWETFDVLDRAAHEGGRVRPTWLTAILPDNTVLASSQPRRFPVGTHLPFVAPELSIDASAETARLARTIQQDGTLIGQISAEIDIADLITARRQTLRTLIIVNGLLALAFAGLGYLAVRLLLRPVTSLTAHVGATDGGVPRPIPQKLTAGWPQEFRALADRYNRMTSAAAERDALAAQLAEEEKVAVIGRLASGMAHEVNNPLGGMMTALDTLKVHGNNPAVRERSIALVERGLLGIRNVVRSVLLSYKQSTAARTLDPADLDDLQFLIAHERSRRQIRLVWTNALQSPIDIDGAAVRQVALNLLLNACVATPVRGSVAFIALAKRDHLYIAVRDEGPGLPAPMANLLVSQDEQPPVGSHGLGLWSAARLLRRLGGTATVRTHARGGTSIRLVIPIARRTLDAAA